MAASIDNPYDLPELSRGVYRVQGAPEGYVAWVVISRTGKRLRYTETAVETIENESELIQTERQLRRWLETKDRRLLKAV